MKRSEAFPSNYLSKEDVQTPIVATIAALARKTLKSDDGDETKTVMSFREDGIKPLILNNTNWLVCEDAYGEDSDMWLGKKLQLYYEPNVMFGAKRVGGVRVRVPAQAQAAPAVEPLTFDAAVALCAQAGISKESLVDTLRADGKSGWNAARDSAFVHQLLADFAAADTKEVAF